MNKTFPDYKKRLFCALASAFLATGLSVAKQKPYVPTADIKVSYDWNHYGEPIDEKCNFLEADYR